MGARWLRRGACVAAVLAAGCTATGTTASPPGPTAGPTAGPIGGTGGSTVGTTVAAPGSTASTVPPELRLSEDDRAHFGTVRALVAADGAWWVDSAQPVPTGDPATAPPATSAAYEDARAFGDRIVVVDAATLAVTTSFAGGHLAVRDGTAWIGAPGSCVTRVDTATRQVVGTVAPPADLPPAAPESPTPISGYPFTPDVARFAACRGAIAAGPDAVWITASTRDGWFLVKVDPATGTATTVARLPDLAASTVDALATTGSALLVASHRDEGLLHELRQLDLATGETTYQVTGKATFAAVDDHRVWVAQEGFCPSGGTCKADGQLLRFDDGRREPLVVPVPAVAPLDPGPPGYPPAGPLIQPTALGTRDGDLVVRVGQRWTDGRSAGRATAIDVIDPAAAARRHRTPIDAFPAPPVPGAQDEQRLGANEIVRVDPAAPGRFLTVGAAPSSTARLPLWTLEPAVLPGT